jgi:hypothetical protein
VTAVYWDARVAGQARQRRGQFGDKGGKVSDRGIVVEGSEGRSGEHQWPFTQTAENRPYPPLLASSVND